MIAITVWPRPIYEAGKDLTEALYLSLIHI